MMSLLRKIVRSQNGVNLLQSFRLKSTAAATPTAPFPINTNNMQKEMDQFMLVFPELVQQLVKFETEKPILRGVAEYFKRSLEYNIPHGKKVRGLTSVLAYKELIGEDWLTSENSRQAYVLGWCIELLQGAFLVADDMIDCSEIRRDAPCWYKLKDVQMIAVNDALMLENACYVLLKHYFGHLRCYSNLFELLHESAIVTAIGQTMDFQMTKADVANYSMEIYRCIIHYKAAHFTGYTPIALAMILAGYGDSNVLSSIKDTCVEMGAFYQVQNDFLDCFGDVLKKTGTDIEDGKCTWLAAKAMEMGSNKQRDVLRDFYGKNDQESVSKVKQLYVDLELPDAYVRYEENTYKNTRRKVNQVRNDKIQQMLTSSVNRIFGRT